MDTEEKIDALLEKQACIIDIFPETVPQKPDDRYYKIEEYFQNNRESVDRKFMDIMLKLFCYFDIILVTQEGEKESPQAEQLIGTLESFFEGETGYVILLFTECDAMLSVNREDLYMTVYNAEGHLKKLISELADSEGLFLYDI